MPATQVPVGSSYDTGRDSEHIEGRVSLDVEPERLIQDSDSNDSDDEASQQFPYDRSGFRLDPVWLSLARASRLVSRNKVVSSFVGVQSQ